MNVIAYWANINDVHVSNPLWLFQQHSTLSRRDQVHWPPLSPSQYANIKPKNLTWPNQQLYFFLGENCWYISNLEKICSTVQCHMMVGYPPELTSPVTRVRFWGNLRTLTNTHERRFDMCGLTYISKIKFENSHSLNFVFIYKTKCDVCAVIASEWQSSQQMRCFLSCEAFQFRAADTQRQAVPCTLLCKSMEYFYIEVILLHSSVL